MDYDIFQIVNDQINMIENIILISDDFLIDIFSSNLGLPGLQKRITDVLDRYGFDVKYH